MGSRESMRDPTCYGYWAQRDTSIAETSFFKIHHFISVVCKKPFPAQNFCSKINLVPQILQYILFQLSKFAANSLLLNCSKASIMFLGIYRRKAQNASGYMRKRSAISYGIKPCGQSPE